MGVKSATNLDALFKPGSVAVVGDFATANDPGLIVMKNLMAGSFKGPVMPVCPEAEAVAGVLTYPDVPSLPKSPDLAVVVRPLDQIPGLVEQLGEKGTKAVILAGEGFSAYSEAEKEAFTDQLMSIARPYNLRILGPKCLGVIVPKMGLNASLAPRDASPGKIAFISQSDSLFTTVLDWAAENGIGFSHFVSLGQHMDIAFAEVIDYLGTDPSTRSILLYVENVKSAREFMSAARAASRNKPILVLRPGKAISRAMSAVPGHAEVSPEIYDVAFRRAGMLRVSNIENLFDAAQTLNRLQPVLGDNLAILTNGGSAGLVAADTLLSRGGRLAELDEATIEAIDKALDGRWERTNPIGMRFDAPGEKYTEVLKILLKAKGIHAVLVMHVPFAGVDELEVAEHVATALKRARRMVITCWLGSGRAKAARQKFMDASIPSYEAPEGAVRAFMYMADYRRSQELLMETPDSLPADFFPDTTSAKDIVARAVEEERGTLTDPEARDVLAAYGVPMVPTKITTSAKEAVIAADDLGYPVAVKLRSPQISQPFDVGGVVLDLETPEAVWDAAAGILVRVSRERPDAYIEGFTVQKMGRRPGAHELYVGAKVDPKFGPVISFGHGGMARQMIQDSAVAIPPLNMSLARELVSRTRIHKLLRGTPNQPPVDMDDICLTLIQVSQLLIDIPHIMELDINPLYADDHGVLALSAKIRIAPCQGKVCDRLAIRPYPRELEECVVLKNGSKVLLRPIRPEDEPAHYEFLSKVEDEDMRLRFFGVVRRDFDHKDMARFTQIDYDREMAFIATAPDENGKPNTLGVIRTATKPDNSEAEFAILVRSDQKGAGLGKVLFDKMIRYTKDRGTGAITGQTLPENKAMQGLASKFGFKIVKNFAEEMVEMTLELN